MCTSAKKNWKASISQSDERSNIQFDIPRGTVVVSFAAICESPQLSGVVISKCDTFPESHPKEKSMKSMKDKIFYWWHRESPTPKQQPTRECEKGKLCELAYSSKSDEKQKKHCQEFYHWCLHGKSCEKKGDPDHIKFWIHDDELEDCKGCPLILDPGHRAQFHHPGLWDWMLPCRQGTLCTKKMDKKHYLKYYHPQK